MSENRNPKADEIVEKIKEYVKKGDFLKVTSLLGRPYEVYGKVVKSFLTPLKCLKNYGGMTGRMS